MHILIACDKFKGSLSATECCEIISRAIEDRFPGNSLHQTSLADGGEGSLDLFIRHKHGTLKSVKVHDSLMHEVEASFGLSKDKNQCFIEMASASGLMLIPEKERNALLANTIGTGELFMHAWSESVKEIIIGVGGSASTDGGTGFAHALGYRFLDGRGRELFPSGKNLRLIQSIQSPAHIRGKAFPRVIAACDVSNPLCGSEGAAHCYARQKGASEEDIILLDEGLKHLAEVTKKLKGKDFSLVPAAGAGGGTGFSLMAFAGAVIMQGFDWISQLTGLEELIRGCDLIITGEGRIDQQTAHGKTVSGVCKLAARHNIPVIAFAGEVINKQKIMESLRLRSVFSLTETGIPREEAIRDAGNLLYQRVSETIGEWILER
ncbi:MAG: glycerate kinase [Bacteroidales bacterium]